MKRLQDLAEVFSLTKDRFWSTWSDRCKVSELITKWLLTFKIHSVRGACRRSYEMSGASLQFGRAISVSAVHYIMQKNMWCEKRRGCIAQHTSLTTGCSRASLMCYFVSTRCRGIVSSQTQYSWTVATFSGGDSWWIWYPDITMKTRKMSFIPQVCWMGWFHIISQMATSRPYLAHRPGVWDICTWGTTCARRKQQAETPVR